MKQIVISILVLFFSYTYSYSIEFSEQDIGDRVPIKEPIPGYESNDGEYKDPFIEDSIIFKITKDNYLDYEKYLTPGQIKMFTTLTQGKKEWRSLVSSTRTHDHKYDHPFQL